MALRAQHRIASSATTRQAAPCRPVLPARPVRASFAKSQAAGGAIVTVASAASSTASTSQQEAAYARAVSVAQGKASQGPIQTFLQGIVGGASVSIGALLMLTVVGNLAPSAAPGTAKLLGALAFPFGQVMANAMGGDVFSEIGGLVPTALFEKQATVGQLASSLAMSFAGNMVGALAMVSAATSMGLLAGNPMAAQVATQKMALPFSAAVVSGVLCNWLVSFGAFQAASAATLAGKVLGLWLPLAAFFTLGLEHSVTNMFLVPMGMAMGAKGTLASFASSNLLPVAIGNLIGGTIAAAATVAYGKQFRSPAYNAAAAAAASRSGEALPTEDEVRAQFYKWNAALATLKPENVAACYASDAVLLPTVSNQVRTNYAEILDYFKLFLTKKPQGVINESYVTIFNPRLTQHTGIYTFALTGADGSVSKVGARFSFTYRKEGDEWKIVEHHSSALPEQVVPAALPAEDEIKAQFYKWNAALATLNPKEVTACYAKDAVLLPTVSNKVRTTPEAIEDYFKLFLTKKPQGVINESYVQILRPDLAAHYGIYTFALTDAATGAVAKVGARFSFTYRKEGKEWKIVEHHSSALPEQTVPAALPAEDEIRGLFAKWNAALATLNPETVADCYAADAVLLPTVSNKVRTNRAAIVDYFRDFLKKKPQGVINESYVSLFNPNLAAHYGIYTFALTLEDGSIAKVGARFSYTYRKEGGVWKIVEHHSSALPEKAASPIIKMSATEDEIRGLFTIWNSALATLNPEKVADCYASDAVLLPTVSNKVRTNRAEIVDYFKLFLTKKPQGVINESYVSMYGDNLAAHYGIYTFALTDAATGKVAKVGARFSYTYRKEGDAWKIVEHHSSALPEVKPSVDVLPTEDEIRALFYKWNGALATLKSTNVADCYAADAVLLPTVSNKVRTDRSAIVDYFNLFLTKKPQGVLNESYVNIFNPNLAQHTGIYTFSLTDAATGNISKVGARFSFTYRKEGNDWKIVEHHSSALPEPAPLPAKVLAAANN